MLCHPLPMGLRCIYICTPRVPNNRGARISVLVLNSTGSPGRFLLSNLLSKNKCLLAENSPKINSRPGTVIRHPRVDVGALHLILLRFRENEI